MVPDHTIAGLQTRKRKGGTVKTDVDEVTKA